MASCHRRSESWQFADRSAGSLFILSGFAVPWFLVFDRAEFGKAFVRFALS
jgi:hypothetical protein